MSGQERQHGEGIFYRLDGRRCEVLFYDLTVMETRGTCLRAVGEWTRAGWDLTLQSWDQYRLTQNFYLKWTKDTPPLDPWQPKHEAADDKGELALVAGVFE